MPDGIVHVHQPVVQSEGIVKTSYSVDATHPCEDALF
jgi:hypothetical protein